MLRYLSDKGEPRVRCLHGGALAGKVFKPWPMQVAREIQKS
jgi:hypothetical protein